MSRGPVRRRWRLLFVVVVGNALVQALAVLPGAVPGVTVLFSTLFLLSLLVLVGTIALISAAVTAPLAAGPLPLPSLRQCTAATLAPLVVAAAGLFGPFLVPVAVPFAVLLVAGAGPRRRPRRSWAGRGPAIVLTTVATVVIAASAWVVALLLGFFVTGFWAALITWLGFGVVGIGVLRWWSVLLGTPSTRP